MPNTAASLSARAARQLEISGSITCAWTAGFGSEIGRGASNKRAGKPYVSALDCTSLFFWKKKTNRCCEDWASLAWLCARRCGCG